MSGQATSYIPGAEIPIERMLLDYQKLTRDNGAPDRQPKTQEDIGKLLVELTCANRFTCRDRGVLTPDCYILEKDEGCPQKEN